MIRIDTASMKPKDANNSLNQLKTTRTSFSIIEEIKQREVARVTEIASALDMPKSTAHRHIVTLQELGYLVRQDEGFSLGLQFLELGDRARSRSELFETIVPELNALVGENEERAQFMVEENNRGRYIYQTKSAQGIGTDSHIGSSVPLYATAAGKSYLASLSDQRLEDLLGEISLEAETPQTIIDEKELREEIEDVRRKGYALNRQEKKEGIYAIGVPVQNRRTEVPVGALSLSIPETRKTTDFIEEMPERLQSSARVIELKITYD